MKMPCWPLWKKDKQGGKGPAGAPLSTTSLIAESYSRAANEAVCVTSVTSLSDDAFPPPSPVPSALPSASAVFHASSLPLQLLKAAASGAAASNGLDTLAAAAPGGLSEGPPESPGHELLHAQRRALHHAADEDATPTTISGALQQEQEQDLHVLPGSLWTEAQTSQNRECSNTPFKEGYTTPALGPLSSATGAAAGKRLAPLPAISTVASAARVSSQGVEEGGGAAPSTASDMVKQGDDASVKGAGSTLSTRPALPPLSVGKQREFAPLPSIMAAQGGGPGPLHASQPGFISDAPGACSTAVQARGCSSDGENHQPLETVGASDTAAAHDGAGCTQQIAGIAQPSSPEHAHAKANSNGGMARVGRDPSSDLAALTAFLQHSLLVHCVTFNMAERLPTSAPLPDTFFTGGWSTQADADLYVFSTQESGPISAWEGMLSARLGEAYTRIAGESLLAIHIVLFARAALSPHIAGVRTSSVATGIGNVYGNKGGVAISFVLYEHVKVLLVGSHFAAHDKFVEKRNADFHRIAGTMFSVEAAEAVAAAMAAAGEGSTLSCSSRSHLTDGSIAPYDATDDSQSSLAQPPCSLDPVSPGRSERCLASKSAPTPGMLGAAGRDTEADSAEGSDPEAGSSPSRHHAGNADPSGGGADGQVTPVAAKKPPLLHRLSVSRTDPRVSGTPPCGPRTSPCRTSSSSRPKLDVRARFLRAVLMAGLRRDQSGSGNHEQPGAGGPGVLGHQERAHPPVSSTSIASSTAGSTPMTAAPSARGNASPFLLAEGGGRGGGGGVAAAAAARFSQQGSGTSHRSDGPSSQLSVALSNSLPRTQSFWTGLSLEAAQQRDTLVLGAADVVLWMGDLNYRIQGTHALIKAVIDKNLLEVLEANDQLNQQRGAGKVFSGFLEQPITFNPTFKLMRGTDTYNEQRIPSWTDRVLYRLNTPAGPWEGTGPALGAACGLEPLYYTAVTEVKDSDHRPVIAGFRLHLPASSSGVSGSMRSALGADVGADGPGIDG